MFDLRYHVASLAAVFLALIIGILVGVGISGKGFVSDSERELFKDQIADLEQERDAARRRSSDLARTQRTSQQVIEQTYPALLANRLSGNRVALVFVGSIDRRIVSLVEQMVTDADGAGVVRTRALKVPIDVRSMRTALSRRPGLQQLATPRRIAELGRRLAQDFVAAGESPLWQALTAQLVEEKFGSDQPAADSVVVVRTIEAQRGDTARFLRGFYVGLQTSGVPAVGAETTAERGVDSAVQAFARADLSSVDDLDLEAGRLALALLLGGATPGSYGVKQTASDGVLPPVEPVPAPAAGG
jgi:hypothetical protein